MATTSGHGNPKWTREEVILALDLYFKCGNRTPSARDSRVIALSEILRKFPYHNLAARKASFRNPDGVAFKLQNLRKVATGKGLGNVSQMDREVWNEYGSNPVEVRKLADLIKAGLNVLDEIHQKLPEYEVFSEGRLITETHLRRERQPILRSKLIEKRRAKGVLFCEICQKSPNEQNPLAESIFEAHHIVPLSAGAERKTTVSDMALLCACCHRLIHKAIAMKGTWLSVKDAQQLLNKL